MNMLNLSELYQHCLFNRMNAVKEICARCPLAMSADLLGDLVQYKSHKDKGWYAIKTAN